jgi:hypothetical protein
VAEKPRANRLANEASPYLLQHAHNPVDWYPWGDQALARARHEDKPIFLSIGYAACHWCHVMERESFEDPDVARFLNEHFVAIKVDREERPDLDEIYMNALHLLGRSGGWPLNVFLTPDLRPFFGGTYFPPQDRYGMPAFRRVLESVATAYRTRRGDIETAAAQVTDALRRLAAGPGASGGSGGSGGALSRRLIEDAVRQWHCVFDADHGGFGEPPKFPPSLAIHVLLTHHARTGLADALAMATQTLDAMARGGLYDQVGGGFHRYAVDRRWLVPHFEKMLYDNALLAAAYLEAFQVTRKPLYERVVRETLGYLRRDLAEAGGGFHSSQDADSQGQEGRYYVWTPAEVLAALGRDDADLFCRFYDVSDEGNFEGRSILHVPVPAEAFAPRFSLTVEALEQRLADLRQRLLAARRQRVPPAKDDKVLTDWNGLAISAFARAYGVLGDAAYREAAERAARFLLATLRGPQGLLHAYRAGRSHAAAYLDDYAFLIEALLDLYEATFDAAWIVEARRLSDEMTARFQDDAGGGFFQTQADQPDLVARIKRIHDAAVPAGSAVAARGLLRLWKLTDSRSDFERAETTLKTFAAVAGPARSGGRPAPTGAAAYLSALEFYLGPVREIAVVGRPGAADTQALLDAARRRFLPARVLASSDPAAPDAAQTAKLIPLLSGKTLAGGRATAYVCENFACREPVTSAEALERLLAR